MRRITVFDSREEAAAARKQLRQEGETIRRRTPEEQAAILKETGPNARQARRQVKLDKNGMRRNTFVYPAQFDQLLKEFVKFLRENPEKADGEVRFILRDGS